MRAWLVQEIALAALCAAFCGAAQAQTRATVQQQSSQALFNWNYAAIYGTGFYSIGDATVAVARIPAAYRLREPSDEHWGLRLTAPVSAAFTQFDLHGFDLGSVSTLGLSVLPGIEVQIPFGNGWLVKPFFNAGKGWEFRTGTTATIWSTGVSSRYQTTLGSKWLAGVGGKVTYAGYRARDNSSILGALSIGGDLGYPTQFEMWGRNAIIGAQLVATGYFNRLEFLLPGNPTQSVSSELSLALTLGASRPLQVLGASIDRLGLGYREGSNGLKGVELIASFPF